MNEMLFLLYFKDYQIFFKMSFCRRMARIFTVKFGHFHFDDAWIDAMTARTINLGIGNDGQEIGEGLFPPFIGVCRHDGSGVNDMLKRIQKTDEPWIFAMGLRRLSDEQPDQSVHDQHGIQFLFHQIARLLRNVVGDCPLSVAH